MLITVRPPNRCRASANATIVPRTVEISVAVTPMTRLFWTDWQTSGAPHGFDQFFSVKPFQMMLERPPSVERERRHVRDRQEQVQEGQHPVEPQRVGAEPASHAPHTSSSVPARRT